jgi:hypothetical protein
MTDIRNVSKLVYGVLPRTQIFFILTRHQQCVMYENEPTGYGFKMTFSGFVDADELHGWQAEVQQNLDRTPDEWHCFVDMRELETMSTDAQQLMSDIKRKCHESGLQRVATLVASPTVRLQFEQMAETAADSLDQERYLDAESYEDPESQTHNWVAEAIEPTNG